MLLLASCRLRPGCCLKCTGQSLTPQRMILPQSERCEAERPEQWGSRGAGPHGTHPANVMSPAGLPGDSPSWELRPAMCCAHTGSDERCRSGGFQPGQKKGHKRLQSGRVLGARSGHCDPPSPGGSREHSVPHGRPATAPDSRSPAAQGVAGIQLRGCWAGLGGEEQEAASGWLGSGAGPRRRVTSERLRLGPRPHLPPPQVLAEERGVCGGSQKDSGVCALPAPARGRAAAGTLESKNHEAFWCLRTAKEELSPLCARSGRPGQQRAPRPAASPARRRLEKPAERPGPRPRAHRAPAPVPRTASLWPCVRPAGLQTLSQTAGEPCALGSRRTALWFGVFPNY